MKRPNFLIIFLTVFVISILFSIGFFSGLNLKLSDNLYGGKPSLDSIVIVAIDEDSIEELGRWPWSRAIFADTITKLKDAKLIAFDVGFFTETDEDKLLQEAVDNSNVVLGAQYTSFKQSEAGIKGDELLKPVIDSDIGYINVITDNDGVTRALNLDISDELSCFSCKIYEKLFRKKLQEQERFLINFNEPFRYYSIADVYNNRTDLSEFKDKIIFIGATASEFHDSYFVPTSTNMPGVEIHAQALQTFMQKDYITPQSNISVIIFIFITALLIGFIADNLNLTRASIISLALILLYIFITIIVFNSGLMLNIVYVPITIILTMLSINSYNYVHEKKSKAKIIGAFNKYVSPAVLKDILKDPDKLKLGGVKREITVFFSDIRGFTTISEKLSPEKLVHLLNEYLTAMTTCIMKHEGVVDKYIGDAIMAFWNCPLNQPDHASLACSTSLDMLKELKELNKKWIAAGYPELKIGIGLNTGQAVIGNMGSYDRFDYTAMGDNINLGSRLEGLTKHYGVSMIISESTYKQVKDKFVTRELDLVAVKGKKEPIRIFELIGRVEEVSDKEKKIASLYEKGLSLYLNKEWDSAIAEFEKVLDFREDLSSSKFIERCTLFKKTPPPKDWRGVWEMKEK
ncbi:adenylate/guanylate cyclase domain-containing protein [Candidatus Woesearchaeota archaeon]|nr:adenylate/guanylate cyclase domain-containing protein [Candidatus Woesearchaeota archaeon]